MIALLKNSLLVMLATVSVSCVHGDRWPQREMTIQFIGEAIFPAGYRYEGLEVGGLSGIDYDQTNDRYVVISDDQAQHGPVRFFQLMIDLVDGILDPGDVVFTDVTQIFDKNGDAFAPLAVDPESIRFSPEPGQLVWANEGTDRYAPFVRFMTPDGHFIDEFALPQKYLTSANTGVRRNKGLESLTFASDTVYLITATENALHQDGPDTSLNSGSPNRILFMDARNGRVRSEFIYVTQPVADAPIPADAFATNGLVELLALDGSHLLALERSYSSGIGNQVRLFVTTTKGASNVRHLNSIAPYEIRPMPKKLLFDLSDLHQKLDNIEGMTFGPSLADGSRTLILVSDDNFNAAGGQFTQFLAFKLSTP